jgi:hypothetical protein
MATYKVLSKLVNADGTHEPGDTVEIPYQTPGEKVAADKLVSYGILEESAPAADIVQPTEAKK